MPFRKYWRTWKTDAFAKLCTDSVLVPQSKLVTQVSYPFVKSSWQSFWYVESGKRATAIVQKEVEIGFEQLAILYGILLALFTAKEFTGLLRKQVVRDRFFE
jgi:hypothetical protein